MLQHDIHECDTHERHADEAGHVHDMHERDTHERHADEAGHVHDAHERDTHRAPHTRPLELRLRTRRARPSGHMTS